MTYYDVLATVDEVNFNPDKLSEILQNVKTILTTAKGSVPLDRDFGIDTSLIDLPVPVAKAKLTANIIDAIEKYEPRVTVSSVSFKGDGEDGIIVPTVKVAINT